MPAQGPRLLGLCGVCDVSWVVRGDGLLRRHRVTPRGAVCAGSETAPVDTPGLRPVPAPARMVLHDCPAPGCRTRVPTHMLACQRDWYRLPPGIRSTVTAAYMNRATDPRGHAEAVQVAVDWYHAHPNNPVGR